MNFIRLVLLVFCCVTLGACGEDTSDPSASVPATQPPVESKVAPTPQVKAVSQSAGGVTVKILPEYPTSTGCLQAVIQGTPGRNVVIWKVNSEVVSSVAKTQLCSDNYKRDDTVTVQVGTKDQGAHTSVSIGNSLPRVVDISSTPSEI